MAEGDVTQPQFSGLARDLHRLRIGGATTCNFQGNDRTEGYRKSDGAAHPLWVCVVQEEAWVTPGHAIGVPEQSPVLGSDPL